MRYNDTIAILRLLGINHTNTTNLEVSDIIAKMGAHSESGTVIILVTIQASTVVLAYGFMRWGSYIQFGIDGVVK